MIKEKVGQNIKKYRMAAGISQKELGKRVGKSESYIGDAENAKNDVSLAVLESIADAVKVPMMAMFDESYGADAEQFDEFAKLRIYNLEDRLTVAGILLKNGYTVSQYKQQKTPTGKALDYFLAVQLNEENADTAR